ncbi:Imm50 family immunity protein [Streptomyces sp. AP-93]|uniref:Imm50 family immunity protein n=1 Tax=Streptomyces sp. AP-93 TaxID=2929048 RepID=UPI0035B2D047
MRSPTISVPTWSNLLVDADRLTSLYTDLPPLEGLVLRSVHLSPYGPGLKLRVELPRYPDRPPSTWVESGCDRLEVQIHFLAVGEDLHMRGLPQQTVVDVQLRSIAQRRLQVLTQGTDFTLAFTAAEALQVSHLNAYQSNRGNPYAVQRHFENRVDQRLHTVLPPVTTRPFYDYP